MIKILFWFSIFLVFSKGFLENSWNRKSQLPISTSRNYNYELAKLNKTIPYCYHFTWMGGKFNKWTFKNIKNKTCAQYFKDKKTLCINPMVATYKGGKPDIDYILNNHSEEATCRLSQEHVCVKYTVYHNGIISQETRYCSAVNIEMEGPMQKGCIQEKKGSQIIEVCACQSQPGPDGICNFGSYISKPKALIHILVLYFIYIFFLNSDSEYKLLLNIL